MGSCLFVASEWWQGWEASIRCHLRSSVPGPLLGPPASFWIPPAPEAHSVSILIFHSGSPIHSQTWQEYIYMDASYRKPWIHSRERSVGATKKSSLTHFWSTVTRAFSRREKSYFIVALVMFTAVKDFATSKWQYIMDSISAAIREGRARA